MGGKCNALLIADKVIREDNGKRGIIGSFNTFNLPVFPATAPTFFVYANLEDFSAQTNVQEIVIDPVNVGNQYMLMSEKALISVWMTPDEDEAWKDL